jgi:DUF218 domain-containing protein
VKHRFVLLLTLGVFLSSERGFASSPQEHEVQVEKLEQKLFPILEALDSDASARTALMSDPTIDKLHKERVMAIDHATSHCEVDSNCINSAFRFDQANRSTVLSGLTLVYRQSSQVKSLVDGLACKSPNFPLYQSLGCEQAFLKAVDDEITGLNNVIDIFGDGKASTRGAVDVAEYDTQSLAYRQILNTLAHNVLEASAPLFQQGVLYGCYLLIANRSDYATRFPGLDTMDNAGAVLALTKTIWSNYKYSVILVPGLGPENVGVPLSPGGRARLRIAVRRYLDGLAPVIIVSGGFVHPPHTGYNEAIEMKKVLVEEFGIPSDAVLVEPFARRTTTNLRNVARLLIRYGISLDKPVLVTTDIFQTSSINNGQISDRCLKTLGYVPFRKVQQLSPVDTSLQLIPESLQFDPRDPLDP